VTGHGLDWRDLIPLISYSPHRPDWLQHSIAGDKAEGTWSWSFNSSYCRDQEWWSYISSSTYIFMAQSKINYAQGQICVSLKWICCYIFLPKSITSISKKGCGRKRWEPSLLQYSEEWLIHYATSCKVVGSRPDKVNEFLQLCLILPAALGPTVYSACNRNEYQKQTNNVSGE
jgi:hypothetical protein